MFDQVDQFEQFETVMLSLLTDLQGVLKPTCGLNSRTERALKLSQTMLNLATVMVKIKEVEEYQEDQERRLKSQRGRR